MFRFSQISFGRTLQPLGPRLLIRRAVAPKETASGILLPEKAAGKLNEGIVMAVGAQTKDWIPSVKPNDTVLLPEYGGNAVKIEGEELILISEDQVLGVFA